MFKLPSEHAAYLRDRENHFLFMKTFRNIDWAWDKICKEGLCFPRGSKKSLSSMLKQLNRSYYEGRYLFS